MTGAALQCNEKTIFPCAAAAAGLLCLASALDEQPTSAGGRGSPGCFAGVVVTVTAMGGISGEKGLQEVFVHTCTHEHTHTHTRRAQKMLCFHGDGLYRASGLISFNIK